MTPKLPFAQVGGKVSSAGTKGGSAVRDLMVTLAILLVPITAASHHSRAEFSSERYEIAGELLTVDWSNPHPVFTMQVVSPNDRAGVWEIQGYGSIYTLSRAGVTGDYFSAGDQIRLYGSHSTRRDNLFLVNNLLTASGAEIVFNRASAPRWNETAIGGEESYVARDSDFVDAASENRGLFRWWSRLNQGNDATRVPPLTPAAQAKVASFDAIGDDTAMQCIPKGMPQMMGTPHPYEFIDDGDQIRVIGHEFSIVRTIHMADAGNPAEQPFSHLGYSVGRWEGNTLVVETTRINWPYFGFRRPQSEAVEVVERFTLSDDQSRLDYHAVITDPVTFTAPVVMERYWGALGETPEPYTCKVDE